MATLRSLPSPPVMTRTRLVVAVVAAALVAVVRGFDSDVDDAGQSARVGESIIHYHGDQNLCPQNTLCTLLSQCRLLADLMDRSCLQASKLRDLACGYRRTEAMVCCPNGGSASPFRPQHHHRTNGSDKINQNCGRPQLNGWRNGYAGLGSQPWVVRVGFKAADKDSIVYPCCGSIITDRVVLTAAHCALAEPAGFSLHSVRVGDFDGATDPDCSAAFCAHPVQDADVSHVVVHPGFERGIFRHDVALLVLKTPIAYSVSARPVCLLQNPNVGIVGRRGKLVGWGKLPGQNVTPDRQQQIDLPVIALEHCSKVYGKVLTVSANQICVGGEANRDACSGFGGAPFVMLDHYSRDRYYQVGMVSFGSDKCGQSGIPSVYTRIQNYYEWIKANVPSDS